MTNSTRADHKIVVRVSLISGAIAALLVYWLTAYPTIAWWSSSELALAAHDMGIMSPPGAVIPTILGWVVMHVPFGGGAIQQLNYFAGILGVAVMLLVIAAARRMAAVSDGERRGEGAPILGIVAATAAGLTFCFGETLWQYAVQYTTYIVTPLFSALIVWSMVHWWQSAGERSETGWLFITALLFGLDLSVHRTNSLLFPGFIAWVMLLHPRSFLAGRNWLAGIGGLVLGLSFHMVIIPMAAAEPFLNITAPSSLSGFWDYVSLKMRGGGFLFNVWPRNADFLRVQVQDWLDAFAATYVNRDGFFGPIGVLPAVLGIFGLREMLRQHGKLAIAVVFLFLCSSLGAIVYFNIPENYFRSLHRHYLPSLVVFGLPMVYGAVRLMPGLREAHAGLRSYLGPVILFVVLLLPINQLTRNFDSLDASETRFAHEDASNLLKPLPPNAILLTTGDNDTFPLWYLQQVENVRTDVTVLNLSLLNTNWFVRQVMNWEPEVPLPFTSDDLDNWSIQPWQDSAVTINVDPDHGMHHLPDTVAVPDSVAWDIAPTIAERFLMSQDYVVLKLLQANRWRRPVYTVPLGTGRLPWLSNHLMREGLLYQVVPFEYDGVNVDRSTTLVLQEYDYGSFRNPDARIERATLQQAVNYYTAFAIVLRGLGDLGRADRVSDICEKLYESIPAERYEVPERLVTAVNESCRPHEGSLRSR